MSEPDNYKITIIPGPTWAQLVSKICQEAAQAGVIPPRAANDVILTTFATLDGIYRIQDDFNRMKRKKDPVFDKVFYEYLYEAATARVKAAMEQRQAQSLIVSATNADLNNLLKGE